MNSLISKFFLFCIIFSFTNLNAQVLEAFPTYNSIGFKLTDVSGVQTVKVEYKKESESTYSLAFAPELIEISGVEQYRGSIFLLDEATVYDLRVTLYDGAGANQLPVVQYTTLASPSFDETQDVKWVSPNGNGDFSQGNPGNLATLFSSGLVTCGTTVLLTNGVYKQSGLQLNLSDDCTESTPIIIMAAPGATPVVDGGQVISTSWVPHSSIQNLYSTTLPNNTGHSNICVLGSTAIYPYPSLVSEPLLGGYNLSDLNLGYDGFVRDENTIWIKTASGANPNDSTVIVSSASRFLTVEAADKTAYLKIKGINFQFFGKPILNAVGSPIDSYGATVLDIRRASHVYIDNCRFNYNTSNVSFSGVCNNLTIQNSQFKHDVGKWSHAMIKKSHDFVFTIFGGVSSSRGRSVENAAIFIDQGAISVVRGCVFNGVNSGVESYFDTGFKEEMDIYENTFIDNFDAIENDGLCSNLRVWNNEIVRPMAAFSVAPPLIGPRYFYRNTVHGMKGRRNEQDDPYFIGCDPIVGQNYRSQAIGIKTNSGYAGSVAPGNLYFFNNTFHADDTLGFVFTSWTDEWKEATFINNSYSHEVGYPFHYFDLANTSVNGDFQLTSANENYFSYDLNSPIAVAKHIHGQFQCTEIPAVSQLESTLSSISTSSSIDIQNPTQNDPGFLTRTIGGFELSNTSPMVNAGQPIQGFYDYVGSAPDIGAKESGLNSIDESNIEQLTIYPNPSTGDFHFRTNSPFTECKLEVMNLAGLRVFSEDHFNLSNSLNLGSMPNGVYFLRMEINNEQSTYKVVKMAE